MAFSDENKILIKTHKYRTLSIGLRSYTCRGIKIGALKMGTFLRHSVIYVFKLLIHVVLVSFELQVCKYQKL